jgi:hypothetical protein
MNEHILRFNEASSYRNWARWSKNHETFPEYLDMYAKTQRENKYIAKILWDMYTTNPLINKLVKVQLHEQMKVDVIKLDKGQ